MLKFSIITVCYNAENFIEDTIKSVINQKHNNYEYVIIDGGSTDNTLKIINSYKDKIDFIVSEPDKGIYDAMNKGLKLAQGEFVNFLNAGDTFCSNSILDLLFQNITNNTKIISGDFYLKNNFNSLKLIKTRKLILKYLKKDFYACHQSIFIKKDIASYYNDSYKIKADYKWTLEAVEKVQVFNVTKINKPIVIYDANGFSSKNNLNNLLELMRLQYNHFGLLRVVFNIDVYLYRFLRDLKNKIWN